MDPAKKRRATYQDVIESPEHIVAEIIGGELRLSNRPAGPATAVASAIGEELGPPFKHGRGGPGGWLILDEPELHLGDEIVDLAVLWQTSRGRPGPGRRPGNTPRKDLEQRLRARLPC